MEPRLYLTHSKLFVTKQRVEQYSENLFCHVFFAQKNRPQTSNFNQRRFIWNKKKFPKVAYVQNPNGNVTHIWLNCFNFLLWFSSWFEETLKTKATKAILILYRNFHPNSGFHCKLRMKKKNATHTLFMYRCVHNMYSFIGNRRFSSFKRCENDTTMHWKHETIKSLGIVIVSLSKKTNTKSMTITPLHMIQEKKTFWKVHVFFHILCTHFIFWLLFLYYSPVLVYLRQHFFFNGILLLRFI